MRSDKNSNIEQALSGKFANTTDADSLSQYDVVIPLAAYESSFFSDASNAYSSENGQYFYVGRFDDSVLSFLDRDIESAIVFLPHYEHYHADNVKVIARSKLTDSAINSVQELAIIANKHLVDLTNNKFRPKYGDPEQHLQNMRTQNLLELEGRKGDLEGYLDIPDSEEILLEMLSQLSDVPFIEHIELAINSIQNTLILPRIREDLLETIQACEISDQIWHINLVCEFDNVNNLEPPIHKLNQVQESRDPENLEIY